VVFAAAWDLIGGLEGIGNALVSFDNYMTDYTLQLGQKMLSDPAIFSYAD
jgi:hypothetical protein